MFKHSFTALTIMAALGGSALLPGTASAQERQRQDRDHRVYDRAHRDYHNWNRDEDRLYREYLTEHHRKYRDFRRIDRNQQRDYWQWRHDRR